MKDNARGIQSVSDDELRLVRGGKSFWERIKAAGRWIKNHITGGLRSIGIKGKF